MGKSWVIWLRPDQIIIVSKEKINSFNDRLRMTKGRRRYEVAAGCGYNAVAIIENGSELNSSYSIFYEYTFNSREYENAYQVHCQNLPMRFESKVVDLAAVRDFEEYLGANEP